MVTSTDVPDASHLLRGTPVVPGVAFGPALVVRSEISPAAIERYGDGGFADAEAALAAYDEAVEAGRRRLPAPGRRASPATRPRC